MTHVDEVEKLFQVVVEDCSLERRVERVRRSVDRRWDASVVLEDASGHSAERRSLLSRRPVTNDHSYIITARKALGSAWRRHTVTQGACGAYVYPLSGKYKLLDKNAHTLVN